ncbi:MAG: alpha/beta hydrolase [Pseudomonadales bacterium]
MINLLIKWTIKVIIVLLVILSTVILVRAFEARRFPDLSNWHRPLIDSEFSADTSVTITNLEEYFELEEKVFAEIDREIYQSHSSNELLPLSRYSNGSRVDPKNFDRNWNRSFELMPNQIRGGVLMIHGLTDSPYSMRHLANFFQSHGFYVLALRMPGHGTIPGELIDATWQDWMAATKMGAKHVRSKLKLNQPLHIVGYSNGGALAVKYALDAIVEPNLPKPDKLILLSPMLGVTFFSRFTDWHKVLSWIPYFEKFRWLNVLPEFDPFKYNSFPKAAGKQTFLLTREINRQLSKFTKTGEIEQLPPILTFQSLVDATVLTSAIVERLYNRIVLNNSELVLFDVNRLSKVDEFLTHRHNELYNRITQAKDVSYTLTIVTNVNKDSRQVVAKTWANQTSIQTNESLNLEWPSKIFSLSHVAIPFPEHDDVYGAQESNTQNDNFNLGTFSPRGERGILTVPIHMLMRLRYNPFYSYMEQRILDAVEE